MKHMSNLYIIAGPNGAGKTTASFTILPEIFNCKEFVNADEIARGISPFQAETVAIEAGRIMLKRIDELLAQRVDFSFETTLSSRTYVHTIRKAHENNYQVTLVYFWLETPDLAVERVKERVSEGGHDISELVIRRRFESGLKNLFELYLPLMDYWVIINNSMRPYQIIAESAKSQFSTGLINEIRAKLKFKPYGNK